MKLYPVFSPEYENQLRKSTYPNLEVFQSGKFSLVNTSTITHIIKHSGGHLRKILINDYDTQEQNFDEECINLIRAIYENCPLVEHLSLILPLSDEHLFEFEKLLKACQKLKVLFLLLLDVDEKKEDFVLKLLSRSAPTNLREIGFFYYFIFSLEALEEFLESWRGRPTLSILTYYYNDNYKEEGYTKIINKYKDDGVIKDLKYMIREGT